MPDVRCPKPACEFQTGNVGDAMGAVLMANHLQESHPIAATPKAPTFRAPEVKMGVYAEEWAAFERQWDVYRDSANVPAAKASVYLLNCCESVLMANIQKEDQNIATKSVDEVMAAIKRLAVVEVVTAVMQSELLSMVQDHDEPVRTFAARAKGIARNCQFKQKCTCGSEIEFSDTVVKMVVINGIADLDIKREVLSTEGLDMKTLTETLKVIEGKERASRSMKGTSEGSQAANSSFRKVKADEARLKQKAKCDKCKELFLKNRMRSTKEGVKLVTFTTCKECWTKENPRRDRKKKEESIEESAFTFLGGIDMSSESDVPNTAVESPRLVPKSICTVELPDITPINSLLNIQEEELSAEETELSTQAEISAENSHNTTHSELTISGITHGIKMKFPHYIFNGVSGWSKRRPEPQPTVKLVVSTDKIDYDFFLIPYVPMKPTLVNAITDTGAQSNLMGLKIFKHLGLPLDALVPVSSRMRAVNNEGINILGAIFLHLQGNNKVTKEIVNTKGMVYVTDSTDHFYLSRHSMQDLNILPNNFPNITGSIQLEQCSSSQQQTADCGCLLRSSPPGRPQKLPFQPLPENIPRMKEWLLSRYAASTFNKCPHQPLPLMDCEPIRIHVKPDAKPVAIHKAASVPIHFRKEVEELNEEDEALGVIEPVPDGHPTVWQSRLVITPKADGSPRRTVDLSHLNRQCLRETSHVVPPFKQARLIPANTWKSVTDAWNGYHSTPLHEDDRDFTTFLTEKGRYRYRVAPQGFVAAGDGYNARYDRIIKDVHRKTKCVDDVCKWDEELKIHWWEMINYIILVGKNGVILNPRKFQFCERIVEFAGFIITDSNVKPLNKYLDSIRTFPRPQNISDIRSWFGLVNQVSHYAKLESSEI